MGRQQALQLSSELNTASKRQDQQVDGLLRTPKFPATPSTTLVHTLPQRAQHTTVQGTVQGSYPIVGPQRLVSTGRVGLSTGSVTSSPLVGSRSEVVLLKH